ncbi:hypothetical protein O9Z70_09485 [Devosia sp. YIM 151766]|nr:hypothetical protein [Devosia sp. YIM 151766]WIY51721.1 hypothetical protein O9Z70_09485 [Devosia sp. YIM 151766]
MNKKQNFFQRAFDAIVESRSREAERYLELYGRKYEASRDKTDRR